MSGVGEPGVGDMAITVFLADDNVIVREGVRRCWRRSPTSRSWGPPATTTS